MYGGTKNLIIGEQHHIYTVLSVLMYTVNAAGYIDLMINGYDSNGGTYSTGYSYS